MNMNLLNVIPSPTVFAVLDCLPTWEASGERGRAIESLCKVAAIQLSILHNRDYAVPVLAREIEYRVRALILRSNGTVKVD